MKRFLMPRIYLLSSLLVLFTGLYQYALDPRKPIDFYIHHVWGLEDGLPQNTINAIQQTRDGYIWMGTQEGLARFNGKDFTVFDEDNTRGIPGNYHFIKRLLEDREGTLWLGTQAGVGRFKNGKFTLLNKAHGLSGTNITALCQQPDGSILVGYSDEGIDIIKGDTVSCLDLPMVPFARNITAIYMDREGYTWVGTDGAGVIRISNKDHSQKIFNEKQGLPSLLISTFMEDSRGNLWIGTVTAGLTHYNYKDESFKPSHAPTGFYGRHVTAIREDKDGCTWIATYGDGLFRFVDGKYSVYNSQKGLSTDLVNSICEDREGNLWIGTAGGGLNQLKDGKFMVFDTEVGLSNDTVLPIFESKAGDMYIGTEGGGVNRISDGKVIVYNTGNGLPNNNVFAIYEDKKGLIWFGTFGGGISCFNVAENTFKTYNDKNGLTNNYTWSLIGDSRGVIWIGTDGGGLNYFKNGKFAVLNMENGLSHNRVISLLEGSGKDLWIGTAGGGLNRLKDGKITIYNTNNGLSENSIMSMYEDNEGVLWIGTLSVGLNRFKNGKFTTITKENGLFSNLVLGIREDNHGNLWMTCNKGISYVSRKELNDFCDGKILSVTAIGYGKSDGMKSPECNGPCEPSILKAKDGRMWFPTLKGAVIIDPAKITINELPPPVNIETVLVEGLSLDPQQKARLVPGTKNIEFHYASLSYISLENVKFKYMLEGYEREWVNAGDRRKAFYTNLSPGAYCFRVIACNNDGIWNNTGASFHFFLEAHIYETWWFYMANGLGLLILGFGIYRFRVRQLRRRKEELEGLVDRRTVQLQEANQELKQLLQNLELANEIAGREREMAEAANRSKSHFLARMSHEIRTPMNSVVGFSEMLLETGLSEEQMLCAHNINRSGVALILILNDITDFSKIEAGELSFEPIDFELETTAFEVCEMISPRIGNKPVEVFCHIGDRVPPFVKLDPLRFRQVLNNLMGNAAKFTEEGEIELSVDIEEERSDRLKIHLTVRDTGIGVPPDKVETIFEAFQQADGTITRKYGGTGLGLSISREIARMMGGDVWVESTIGKGSVFHFTAWAEKSNAAAETMPSLENLAGKKVLIVDDNANNLKIMERLLMRNGISVTALSTGRDVIATLQGGIKNMSPFDLCILDIQMPDMSGYEVAEQIRKLPPPIATIPLLAFSSSLAKPSQINRETLFDIFLIKPVRSQKILSAIEKLLGKSSDKNNIVVNGVNDNGKQQKTPAPDDGKSVSLRILLAEDNPINQKLARYMLSREGFRLEMAENGNEAVAKLVAEPTGFDLILMDIQMPEMDGREAARIIRSKGFTRIPIIAMTAESMKGDREKCLESGMNDYISKPINRDEVLKMIKKWI